MSPWDRCNPGPTQAFLQNRAYVMAVAQKAKRPHVVVCSCAYYDIIPQSSRDQILAALGEDATFCVSTASSTGPRQDGGAVEVVSDLCGLAANRDPRLKTWADGAPLTVVACFPRAVCWLFHAAGAPLPDGQARILNMRTQSPEEIIEELMKDNGLLMIEEERAHSASAANHQSSIINHQSDWVPWFPVIDYDRCRNCKQCLNFCLFGVYALSAEGRVEVQKPSGCKTNCPACARMCPNKAIIFPKYADAHINGDETPVEIADRGLQIADSSRGDALKSGDILERIRQHGAGRKRFAKPADGQASTRSCPTLDSLRRDLGIPDDVLASLTPAELQRINAKSQGNPGQSPGRSTEADRKDKDHNG
jgi:NAD-dependent dihydropyrimidine dehydrogenase PreA subunit